MQGWLTKMAEEAKSDDELLRDTLENLPPSMLQELAMEFDPSLRPTEMEAMEVKIAKANRMGQELAYEHGDKLEKQAFIGPMIAGAARLAAGAGAKRAIGTAVGTAAKDAVLGGATKAITNGIRSTGSSAMAGGGFNYGKVAGLNLAGMGRQAAGFLHQHPGAAVTLAGAGAGALMAPRDPQTGQKQYLRGAVMGGGLAAGANALSQGRIADKAKHMVTRQNNPIFGQGARRYAIESAYQTTRPGAAAAASAAAPVSGGGSAASSYRGGPTMGQVKLSYVGIDDLIGGVIGHHQGKKQSERGEGHTFGGKQIASALLIPGGAGYQLGRYIGHNSEKEKKAFSPAGLILRAAFEKQANRATLTYDPATKTFTRQHLTADTTMGSSGSDVIPAGRMEPVGRPLREPARGPAPASLGPSRGTSQVHTMHGGDVMSSSPRPGVAARVAGTPPPIPAAARRPMGGFAGMAGAAAKPKLPSLAGAVSLVKKR